MKQQHYIVLYLSMFLLTSCLRTRLLNDGYTNVATNPKVYKNKKYFDNSVLEKIDTAAIYEEVTIKGYDDPNTNYGVYRFYSNGRYNLFHLNRDNKILTPDLFDPTINGWRGILYKEDGKIFGDLITQTGEIRWAISRQTQEFLVNGDTLIVTVKNLHSNVYLKRRVPNYLLNHTADW